MDKRRLALTFLERFCAGDVDGLEPLLAPDLRFRGPSLRCGSAQAYLDALRQDPPQKSGYRLLDVTEEASSVSVLWIYDKPGGSLTIAQLFGVREGRIGEIILVFDPGAKSATGART